VSNLAIRNGLGYATLALMIAALFMVFDYVPPEAEQGIAQLIFYFHVPLAWVAFASFGIVAIAGIFYLWLGDQLWDDLGYAAAETDLGNVVDVGLAADDHLYPVADVRRLPDAACER
jgi:cellobiose-specific phosphotransferase system component IIC